MTTDELIALLNGMTLAEAERLILNHKYTPRVVSVNGNLFTIILNYNTNRINLDIQDGLVTKASVG